MARGVIGTGPKGRDLPICGAKTRNEGATYDICHRVAGYGTDHKGQGRCKYHGGGKKVKSGRYSKISRPRIAELIEQFEQDPEPYELLAEVQLLRALVQDYIERYDEFTEALITWYDSVTNPMLYENKRVSRIKFFEGKNKKLLQVAREAKHIADENENYEEKKYFKRLIKLLEYEQSEIKIRGSAAYEIKPHKIIDILQVGSFIVQIGALVEKINKQKDKNNLGLPDLLRIMQTLGDDVVKAALEEIEDEGTRNRFLARVSEKWKSIRANANR